MGGGGEIASAFVRIRPEMKGFQGEVHSGVRSAFGGVGKIVAGSLVAAGAAAGAVGAGLVASAKSAISFEKSMRNVNSIANLGEKQFKSLGNSVTGMAAEVGQKPKVLADGLYDLVSSGFKASDAVKVLKVSARAATAGLTDAATASGAVAAALNAYHMGADKARKVSDILFQTVNKGVLTFGELAQNMGDLVPASAPLGISLEEVGAAMSTITLQGVPAAEAATRVKNAMLQIATPSKDLTKLFKQNGFASGAAAIKSLGFSGVLGMLSKATGGNVDAMAKLIPEMRGMLGVVGLTGKNTAVYTENLKSMTQASKGAGITAKVFAEQSKSLAVQWDKFSARMDVFKVKIGSALIPSLSKGLDHLNMFFTRLDNAKGGQAKLKVVWEEVKDIASALAGKVRDAVAAIDWRAVWSGAVGMGEGLTERLGAAVALVNWGVVWGQAAGISDALAARFEQIDWSNVGRAIGDGIAASVARSTASAKKLSDSLGRIFRSVDWVPIGKAMGPGIAAALATALVTIMDPSFWIRNWDLALAVALTVFRVRLLKVFQPLGKLIGSTLGKAWGDGLLAVTGVIERFAPRIASAVLTGLLKLPALVLAPLGKLYEVVTKQFARLGKVTQFVVRVLGIGAVIDAVSSLLSGISGIVVSIVKKLAEIVTAIFAAKVDVAAAAYELGKSIVTGVLSGLAGLFTSVAGAIKDKVGGAISWARGHLGSTAEEHAAKELGKPVAEGIIYGFLLGIRDLPSKMKDSVRNALTRARDIISRGQGIVGDAFSKLGTYATRAFEAATDAHLTKMQTRFEAKIKRLVTGPLDKALSALDKRTAKALSAVDKRQEALTPTEKKLKDLEDARDAASRAGSISDAEKGLKAAQTPGRDADAEAALAVALREQGDAVSDLATKEAALAAVRANAKATTSARTAAETAVREARQKADDFVRTVGDLQAKVQAAMTPDPEAVMAAQRALDDARWEQQRFDLQRQADTERVAADKAAEAARVKIEADAEADRVAAEAKYTKLQERLQREYDTRVLNYQSERDLQEQHLGTMLSALQERLKLHPEEWKKINAKIQALFKNAFGPEYKTAGKNLGTGFAEGIRESFGEVRAAAHDLAAILAKYLPHSPAEVGPLSKPINWKAYLTDGLKPGLVAGAVAAALATGTLPSLGGTAAASGTPQITGALAPLGQLVATQTQMLDELRIANEYARDGKMIQVAVDGVPVATTNPNQIAQAVRR